MRRFFLVSLVSILIVSIAAPAGAVFATEDSDPTLATADQVTPEGSEDTPEDDIVSDAPSVETDQPPVDEVDESDTPDVPPPPPLTYASSVIITEVQTQGVGGAVDERVVLYNASDNAVDITGWCVRRESASGGTTTRITCFAPSDDMASTRVIMPTGATVLLLSTGGLETHDELQPDATFTAGMANSGGRVRIVDNIGATIDLIGWGSAADFLVSPAPALTQIGDSLQRNVDDGRYVDTRNNGQDFLAVPSRLFYETGALMEITDYCRNVVGIQETVPEGMLRNSVGDCIDKKSINFCEGVTISEVAANTARQYVELVNRTKQPVSLEGCRVMTNRSVTAAMTFSKQTLEAGEYVVVFIESTPLKLTKSTTGTVYLIASDGETEVDSVFYEDLSADTSWSYFADGWKQTYDLTPGVLNSYARFASCPIGQVRNEATGRCRSAGTDAYRLVPCREGQYRSEQTNRCRSIALAASVLRPCRDDQFRNPATNRCRKIANADDIALADCGEGRERNPLTNRCRNILAATPPPVDFAVEPVIESTSVFVGWWILGGVTLAAISYAGWEWREEIGRAIRKTLHSDSAGK